MAFSRKKLFAKLYVADANSDLSLLVLKTVTPTVLGGGVTTDNGGTNGKVNVTACKYIVGSKVSIAPAVTDLAIATTGDSVAVDIATNTIVAVVAADIAAAITAKTKIWLATGAHSGGTVTPTLKRRLLKVALSSVDTS